MVGKGVGSCLTVPVMVLAWWSWLMPASRRRYCLYPSYFAMSLRRLHSRCLVMQHLVFAPRAYGYPR